MAGEKINEFFKNTQNNAKRSVSAFQRFKMAYEEGLNLLAEKERSRDQGATQSEQILQNGVSPSSGSK